MKRLFVALILGTFVLSYAQNNPKMLLFMRDTGPDAGDLEYMIEREVNVMIAALEKSGFTVVIATLDGKDVTAGAQTLKCDLKLTKDIKIDDYAGFMFPCLSAPSYPAPPYVSPEAEALAKNAVAADKPVAAQVGSVWTLAKAGVLKGKKYAYTINDRHSYFSGGIWSGDGVVRDGLVMTSGICPWVELKMGGKEHSEELALALAKAMQEGIATEVISVKMPIVHSFSQLRVKLFTLAGELIYRDVVTTKVVTKHISTKGLPNGAYILKITDGKEINLSSMHIVTR
ncbi:MAG: DJ-1/PfpI family protein [Chitinispirillaceae bacterium]|nr:DJ-1/PfpI family protein [Chitinispirillaceae bacterium]